MPNTPPEQTTDAVRIEGTLVRAGQWSGDLTRVTAASLELRRLLAEQRIPEARDLVQTRADEEQAALVTVDENPEQVLALTGMDERGRPAYRGAVVDRLPSELLAQLAAPRTRYTQYNPELLRVMSAPVFDRAVREVMDPIDNPELRTQVAWEWLEAVAALDDPNQAAELLRHADLAALEDAIMDRLSSLDLSQVVGATDAGAVSRFQAFTEGLAGDRPGELIEDSETADILDALWAAAPDLLTAAVVGATRRLFGT